ncbi:ubx4p [Saccharomyces arboricola H-6]|uniref:Ubx4p n=1 Tax=Saccharomyces arboricola (strain H-6 / AS 2.3317 / CBS 10644) TaxID=1160507 RepID=J8PYG8_SACAR|nr:ubx4p [Saccharomyces arboricola H-6]
MPTVTVKHNFQPFKFNLSSNSTLNDALQQSLQFFQVHTSSNEWALLHLNKPVPLDLPWRLLNLPVGVNLELSKNPNFPVANAKPSNTIKIRFQIPGRDSIIKKIALNEPIAPILQNICGTANVDLKIQVFSNIIDYNTIKEDNLTLENLGIQEPSSIRLLLSNPSSSEKNTGNSVSPPKQNTLPVTTSETVAKSPHHELHKPSIYLPSNEPLALINDQIEDEEDYELTVEQAKRYQKMLSMKAGTLGGPILTKRLREQSADNLSKKNKAISECLLRIKFPDRSHIEIAFKPNEDMHTVYKVVSQFLIDETMNFTLNQSHPFKPLAKNDQKLLDDLQFGSKVMLLFETDSTSTGPLIKSHLLKDAQKITHQTMTNPTTDTINKPNLQNDSSGTPKIKKTLNKVPKWMKLSKK